MVAASIGVIGKPLPGTQMRRAPGAARSSSSILPCARGGQDLFSRLCHVTWEDGLPLSTEQIVDHMSFLDRLLRH
jgi:hypothetical protein